MALNASFHVNTTGHRDYVQAAIYILTTGAFAIGAYVRLKGLGQSPFAIDEYFIATSVRNILKHGLPEFDCGGYYTRGLLLQYIAAPLLKYGTHDEFYLRLITVVCNLLTLLPLFLLANRIAGRTIACLVSILFCLSIWEIEFARFARMYAPFQMLFIWYLYFLYQALVLRTGSAKRWMYLLSFVSIFVYEGAIFLVLLNFIPILWNRVWTEYKEYIIPVLIVLVLLSYAFIDFRRLGVEDFQPADRPEISDKGGGFLDLPVLLMTTIAKAGLFWRVSCLVIVGMCLVGIGYVYAHRDWRLTKPYPLTRASVFAVFILLALCNLYGLIVQLLVFVVLYGVMTNRIHLVRSSTRSIVVTFILVITTLVFWLSYALSTNDWRALLTTERTSLAEHLVTAFINYPPVYSKIVFPWVTTLPVTTVSIILLAAYGVVDVTVTKYERKQEYLMLLLLLVGLSIVMSVLSQPYHETRYIHFMYPVLLLLACISMQRLSNLIAHHESSRRAVLGGLFLGFITISEDFGVDHLWNIDSDRILYRIGMDRAKFLHYYPRYDFRTTAAFVNQRQKDGDVMVSTVYGIPYYLRRINYFVQSYEFAKFDNVVACNGTKDLWANATLIYRLQDLKNLLENRESTIWLIAQPQFRPISKSEPDYIEFTYGRYKVFQSVDGTLDVYRIPANQKGTQDSVKS